MTQFSWHSQIGKYLVEYFVDSILSDYTYHGKIVKEMHYLRGNGYTMSSRLSLKYGLKKQVIGRIVTYLEQNVDIPAGTLKDMKVMNRVTTAVLTLV